MLSVKQQEMSEAAHIVPMSSSDSERIFCHTKIELRVSHNCIGVKMVSGGGSLYRSEVGGRVPKGSVSEGNHVGSGYTVRVVEVEAMSICVVRI